uniref:Integrase putative n=1 Tax=Albugo laibachii Nc14 TaxID=890382 RepID=F0WU99_9STRA|nr:integrase putative [Albugo laibachii Nc14]|eukprot:CCA24977.1 integrase putative [Albugo laibachii Nc14]
MTDIKVKILRSDNGGEYKNASMNAFCKKMRVKQEYTVPYNPEQNGMAERMTRTLLEMTRCMLKDISFNKSYWCKAMMTAVDIRNVLPNSSDLNSCPFEMLFQIKPHMNHMRVFGSQCYAHVAKKTRKKLADTGIKCFFLEYSKEHKAYRLLYVKDGSIVISRSVIFTEHSTVEETQSGKKTFIEFTDINKDPTDHEDMN